MASLNARELVTSEQLRAARALVRWEQRELAEASGVSLPTIKRLEAARGRLGAHTPTVLALQRALEGAGVTFIATGGTVGVSVPAQTSAGDGEPV